MGSGPSNSLTAAQTSSADGLIDLGDLDGDLEGTWLHSDKNGVEIILRLEHGCVLIKHSRLGRARIPLGRFIIRVPVEVRTLPPLLDWFFSELKYLIHWGRGCLEMKSGVFVRGGSKDEISHFGLTHSIYLVFN